MTWENARFEVPAEIVASSIIMPALRDLKAIIVLHQEALNTPARTKALRNPGNSVKKPEIGAIILGVAFAENPCKNREIPANPRRNRPSRPERPERPAAVPVSPPVRKKAGLPVRKPGLSRYRRWILPFQRGITKSGSNLPVCYRRWILPFQLVDFLQKLVADGNGSRRRLEGTLCRD